MSGRFCVRRLPVIVRTSTVTTPLGLLWAGFSDHALVLVSFKPLTLPLPNPGEHPLEHGLTEWFGDYFSRRFRPPDVPLFPAGTPFQQRVWAETAKIPAGELTTYGQLSADLGTAPRAVGNAMAANPVPIVIPCHRVVGATGKLGGYSGGRGVETKRWLLQWEGALANR